MAAPAPTDTSLTPAQWRRWENVGLAPSMSLDDLELNWVKRGLSKLEVHGAISALRLDRTMEGASTLTITLTDPRGQLTAGARVIDLSTTAKARRAARREPVAVDEGWDPILAPDVIGRALEVELDGVTFRLVKVSYTHSTHELVLTFEDRLVYWLRRKRGSKHSKPRTKDRKHSTRAEFVLSLFREVHAARGRYRFVCPELHQRQAVTRSRLPKRGAATGTDREDTGGGLPAGTHVLVKGKSANAEQRRIGTRVLQQADADKATGKARLALMEAVIVESEVKNLPGGDQTSVGVLQLLPKFHGLANAKSVEKSVHLFLTRGFKGLGGAIDQARKYPHKSAGIIAADVQGPREDLRGAYDQQRASAQTWIDAWPGGGSSRGGGSTWTTKSYLFKRNSDENSWTAMQRLAQEVNWRCFVVGRSLYFMSEDDLYTRRSRYTVSADDPAVLELTYDVDWGKPVSEATLTVSLERWGAPPGSVVVLDGWGPPDGRWLVAGVSRDWFAASAEVTLKQPGKAKLEPANAREERASAASGTGTGAPGTATAAQRVYAAARAISRQNLPYAWGGGHPRCGHPSQSTRAGETQIGYDCSGCVAAALAAGGCGFSQGQSVPDSGHIASGWGRSGEGKYITVYANSNHVFMHFTGLGTWKRFDTSASYGGGGTSGPHVRSTHRPTGGFTARHWPGT